MTQQLQPDPSEEISLRLLLLIRLEGLCFNIAVAACLLAAALLIAQEINLLTQTEINMIFIKASFAFGILQLIGQRILIILIRRKISQMSKQDSNAPRQD